MQPVRGGERLEFSEELHKTVHRLGPGGERNLQKEQSPEGTIAV